LAGIHAVQGIQRYHQDDGVTPAPGAQDVYVNLDQWDGYQYKRQQIISALKQADVDNFVAITGDLHSFTAGYLYENFDSLNNAPEPAPDPPSAPGWSTQPECASWPAP
jgi:phosphodiesterase/alkaline phosphatase D-like protein